MIETLFDELSDGICISDENGNIVYLNPEAEKLLDAASPQARGKPVCELLCGHLAVGDAPECASTCALRQHDSGVDAVTFKGRFGPKEVSEWKDYSIKRRLVRKNLRVRCLKSVPSLIGEGRHLTLIEDVSAELEAAKQKEDWREMIAHDLRSPLTSIYFTLRLFQDSKTPENGAKLLDISVRACHKMLDLLELYLGIAKLDAGTVALDLEPVGLAKLVGKAVQEQFVIADGKRVTLKSDVPGDLFALADAKLLDRVIQNLLHNALKFTPEGGQIAISARRRGEKLTLSVRDTGPGIANADLAFIFDRYYQAKKRRAGATEGTGLGLAFCRQALSLMGGAITVESEQGAGADFTITLPLASASAAAPQKQTESRT